MAANGSEKHDFIPWATPSLTGNEREYVLDALESTWISNGKYVDTFEKEYANYVKSKHAITASNGTTALQLALLGAQIGPGDEVIVPAFTFVATGNAVLHIGAKPVFADITSDTWCIDPNEVKKLITPATKAIMPTQVYGNIADMAALRKIADEHNILIIEDAAEAIFSKWNGIYAGCIGDIGCCSFHAIKTITTGEGGMVTTDNDDFAARMKLLKEHGVRPGAPKYWHDIVGYNFRMTNLQAAIGCAQMEQKEAIIADRSRVYSKYCERLAGINEISLQKFEDYVDPVVWGLPVKINPDKVMLDRDSIMAKLQEANIEVRPGFYPFSVMPAYDCPRMKVAEEVSRNIVCLPFFTALTNEDIDYISDTFISLINSK